MVEHFLSSSISSVIATVHEGAHADENEEGSHAVYNAFEFAPWCVAVLSSVDHLEPPDLRKR